MCVLCTYALACVCILLTWTHCATCHRVLSFTPPSPPHPSTASTRPHTPQATSLSSSPLLPPQQQDMKVAIGITVGMAILIVGIALVVMITYKHYYRAKGPHGNSKEFLASSSPAFSEAEPPWGAGSQTAEMWLESKKEAGSDAPERLVVIGCGQVAKVFKGRMKNHVVAVKVFEGGKRGKECWRRETEIYRIPMLKHENIVAFM